MIEWPKELLDKMIIHIQRGSWMQANPLMVEILQEVERQRKLAEAKEPKKCSKSQSE